MALRRIFSRPGKMHSDQELLELYKQSGDSRHLGQLYERYLELAYGVCLKYLQDEQSAEDAVMGVFEHLLKKVNEHEIQTFDKWLHSVLRNYCLMQLRRENRHRTMPFDQEFMQFDTAPHPSDHDHDADLVQQGLLNDCMESLSAKQKDCIRLFYLEDHSYKSIADSLQEDLGSVRSYIQNGRRMLRNCMEGKAKTIKRDH